jgi:phosphoadenosine phosphosulfate reductase
LRDQRWYCETLKEFGGQDRYCITGVRWAESTNRANNRGLNEISGKTKKEHIILNNDNDMRRRLAEMCLVKQRFMLNPIIDWENNDVWEFIKNRNLPVNPLYGQGWERVGCIGCPLSENGRIELDLFPKYKDAYFKAAAKYWERRKTRQRKPEEPESFLFDNIVPEDMMESPESYFDWWLRG